MSQIPRSEVKKLFLSGIGQVLVKEGSRRRGNGFCKDVGDIKWVVGVNCFLLTDGSVGVNQMAGVLAEKLDRQKGRWFPGYDWTNSLLLGGFSRIANLCDSEIEFQGQYQYVVLNGAGAQDALHNAVNRLNDYVLPLLNRFSKR